MFWCIFDIYYPLRILDVHENVLNVRINNKRFAAVKMFLYYFDLYYVKVHFIADWYLPSAETR